MMHSSAFQFTIYAFLVFFTLWTGTLSCSVKYGEKPSAICEKRFFVPDIYPDYTDISIPPNIAPLNFVVKEAAEKVYLKITGSHEGEMESFGKDRISFKEKKWKQLVSANQGGSLTFSLFTKQEGCWIAWQDFSVQVENSPIDPYLVYRLIEPGYEKWHIVGIYQRSLENFEETPVIRNDMTGYGCINCHSFCNGDPEQFLFHMRAANNGTYIIREGEIEKLRTKTDRTISNLVYPYWHPSGKYITASVNDTHQFFHAVKDKKMEVFDMESDVVIYDVENQTILSRASLLTKDAFETFPSFSPDGQWLYFCTTPATTMPEKYEQIRYHLCRMAFDENKGILHMPIDTLVHADSVSTSFPRISPDGHFLMYTETAYGQFPIWHKDAEIRMIDLKTGSQMDMSAVNSQDTESYHSWSSNSRWVVISSRRDNGLYTLPYIAYIDEQGKPSKPFLLPQKYPDFYDYLLYSYNIPELARGKIQTNPYQIQHVSTKGQAEQIKFK